MSGLEKFLVGVVVVMAVWFVATVMLIVLGQLYA